MKLPLAYITAPWEQLSIERRERCGLLPSGVRRRVFAHLPCRPAYLPQGRDSQQQGRAGYGAGLPAPVPCAGGLRPRHRRDRGVTAERLRITATTLDGYPDAKGQGRGKGGARQTVGQLMEEMRSTGAQNYHGHEYMDLGAVAQDTRDMIIFDVLTDDSPVGWKDPPCSDGGRIPEKPGEPGKGLDIKTSQSCQGAPGALL